VICIYLFSFQEKSGSVKATSVSISPLFQDLIRKKTVTKSIGKKKGNQGVSVLPDKKGKGKKKSFSENKKDATKNGVHAQSILNKQSKVRFSTVLDSTDVTCKSNSSCKPNHVTFSNDILGWTAPEQPQSVQKSQRHSEEGLDHHSGDELQLFYRKADCLPGATEGDTGSLTEIVVSTGVCCTFPIAKPKEGTAVPNAVDRNQCTEISNSSNHFSSNSLPYLSSKTPSQNLDGVYSHLNNNEDFSLDIECLEEENHVIPQESSYPVSLAVKAIYGDHRSALSQPSNSGLDDRRRSTLTQRMITNHHQQQQQQQPSLLVPAKPFTNHHLSKFHHRFIGTSKDVMNGTRSSSGKPSDAQTTDCTSACRNKYLSNDYMGLPLNSHGEFVKLRPSGSGTPSSINISQRQCLGESSSCPMTCTDHVILKPSQQVPKTYTVDQSPHFTPTAPKEYEMDFGWLPFPERMEGHKYTVPGNKCPFTNQHEPSAVCFCSEHMECHNPQQKLSGMQSCFMRHDCEQNTLPTAEATMRLMGKTVTLGSSSIQCRDLNIDSPVFIKQTQAEDRSYGPPCRKAFPQLFHWEMVDPPSAFRIPHGERRLSENLSFLSFGPAGELRSELDTNSFRTNGYSQQPKPAADNLYVQPATWCNEGELQHQHPVMPNQVQSPAEDMLLVSMHHRNTQNVASGPCFNGRNGIRNSMEKRWAPYPPGYFTQKSNMTQRNLISSSLSGYAAVPSAPGLTTQTKFTVLPPLPPSLATSHVNSPDYAHHRGSNSITFDPSIPAVYQASKSSAPANSISRDKRLKWAMMGSNVEGSGHVNGNSKRPGEKDGALLTSPKKPCTAAQKDLNLFPIPQRDLQFCGTRPDAQPVVMPASFRPGSQPDLQHGNRDAHTTWSYPVSMVMPDKSKPGAKRTIQPSASSTGQDILWSMNPVTPIEARNAACTGSTSKNHRETEIY
jgi:hypothetical protein